MRWRWPEIGSSTRAGVRHRRLPERGSSSLASLGMVFTSMSWTTWLGFGERYNPNNDAWKTVDTPLVGEWRSPGVVVFDTSIYAIGGWSGDYLSLNQEYKPRSFHVFIPVSSR